MSRYRVLLVESNRDLCQILQEYLRRADLDVLSAHDPVSALDVARRERPDLVVCGAPLAEGSSGLELIRTFRSEASLASVPRLLLTGPTSPEARLASLQSGAEDYLLKPFTMKELVYRCERLIVHHRKSEPGELSGDLSRFKSTDILQLLEANQATGVLHIDGEFQGEIHLLDGYICGCFLDGHRGEEAAYRLIPVRNGRFHFVRSNIRSNIQSVRSTTEFMMEALRRHDEKAKLTPASQ